MDPHDLAGLPYDHRRLITVVEALSPPESTAPQADADDRGKGAVRKVLRSAFPTVSLLGVSGQLTIYAMDAALELHRKRQLRATRTLLKIDRLLASNLHFPVGHPRTDVVYAGHPADWRVYIPMADFHRFLFEHKVAEAQRLLRSLGATSITVEHVEGWDQSVGISASVGVPTAQPASVKASGERLLGHERSVMATMELDSTSPPYVPDNLVWMSHEPLWQEIAEARIRSGLKSFTLDVRSTDDYGINGGLKAAVGKAGLDVGGEFRQHKSTIWRMAGTFGAVPDTEAAGS